MERNDIDWNVVVTQTAKGGSADLYSMMPWVARLPADSPVKCEGTCYGRGRRCKRNAALLYIDLDGSVHYFCSTHLYDERISPDHNLGTWDAKGRDIEDPEVKRARKFWEKHVEWSEQHKADIAAYNAQFEEEEVHG